MTEGRSRGKVRAVFAYRDFRYLLSGLAISAAGDWLYGVALVVYVIQETNSPGWVAAASILRLLPFVVFGPLGGAVADRYDRRTVMIVCDLLRAGFMFSLAFVAATSGPILLAVLLPFFSTISSTAFMPAFAALTPNVVGEKDLAAANAVMSTIEHLALVVGPALGGLLLVMGSAASAFAVNGATFLVSAVCIYLVRTGAEKSERGEEEKLWQRLSAGGRVILGSGEIAVVVGLIMAATFIYGQELVLLVLASERFLGMGAEGVTALTAAVGLGGLLAAGVTGRLVEAGRPALTIALAVFATGLPLAALAFVRSPVLAVGLMLVEGAGNIILDVTAMTMLQRSLDRSVTARVFGLLDALAVAALLLGTLIAPILLQVFGLEVALLVAGGLLPVCILLGIGKLRGLDERSRARTKRVEPIADALARFGVFAGAPRPTLEAIAETVEEVSLDPGDVAVSQGDAADYFYLVLSGTFEVEVTDDGGATEKVRTLEEGDYFGEIGLIRKVERTATVRATSAARVYRVDGEVFVEQVKGSPAVSGTLLEGITTRLARAYGRGTTRQAGA